MLKNIKGIYFIIFIFIAFFLVLIIGENDSLEPSQIEEIFIASIPENADLNSGIIIEVETSTFELTELNWFIFEIINKSSEEIRFQDRSLGLHVFRFIPKKELWEAVRLFYMPSPVEVILHRDPSLNQDPSDNAVALLPMDLDINENDHSIRIYVTGIGVETNKVYGAFVDIELIHP